jgi:DNA phosphorothioation-dependent restriction protein DptH
MTKHIFDYISTILLQYFKDAHISKGSRFHVRFEHDDQVAEQYQSLSQIAAKNNFLLAPFSYADYTSYAIHYENYNLIIAANVDGVDGDFMTGLRNRIKTFDNSSILFIHNTSLDSINNGCKSLTESEMPLNSALMRNSLQNQIQNSIEFKNYEKEILIYKLHRVEEGEDDGYSLFNYSIFLEILGKGYLETVDFKNLGLFKDSGLQYESKEDLKKRLRQNEEWFDQISDGHQYGGLEKILEKTFSEKGVTNLQEEDWYARDFTELLGYSDEKDKIQNVSYIENPALFTEDGLIFWDKADGETPAKQRLRHIVIFNEENLNHINLKLNFDGKPRNGGVNLNSSASDNIINAEFTTSQRHINLCFELKDSVQTSFKSLSYEHPGTGIKSIFNVLILPFAESFVEDIKSSYRLLFKGQKWSFEVMLKDEIVFNSNQDATLIASIKSGARYDILDGQTLKLKVGDDATDSDDDIRFEVEYSDVPIYIKIANEVDKPKYISGLTVWQTKQNSEKSFKYITWFDTKKGKDIVSLTHGTTKYYPVDKFRDNLKHEQEIITTGHLAFFEDLTGNLIPEDDIIIDEDLLDSYNELIKYYRLSKQLPSLTILNSELTLLAETFVLIYIKKLEELEEGKPLSKKEFDLLKIGTIEMLAGDKFLKFTPLHPLNLAYQLRLQDEVGHENTPTYLLDKLRPINLLPIIRGKRRVGLEGNYFYQPIEQEHSAEWQYFFCDEVSSQQISKYFVPELVHEKIRQFLKHFRYLFINEKSTLKINIFNQGDAKEVLLGVLNYYAQFFKKDLLNPDDAIAIQITIYGSKNYMTKFEELTLCDDVSVIEKTFDLKFPKVSEPEDLFDLFNKKVTFYKMGESSILQYSHLSFYQFAPSEVAKSTSVMNEIPSGISLDGLLADVPSVFQKNSFRTGFGSSDLIVNNPLLELAVLMNAFVNVAHTESQFSRESAISYVISKDADKIVERICDKSQWVTFIEPKVDLSFFKSYKDVVIIHYSDQYNNASGYDAITITSKWEPYRDTIKEVFVDESVNVTEESVKNVIDLFNAINGQWLLMLNNHYKTGSNFRMEKLSLLSAVKLSLALLDHSNITWIPISMEEILRVSGAVGLKQTNGLFSVKNLGEGGAHSDDLLMLGLEVINTNIHFHCYPVEVKIGGVDSSVYEKAKEQSKKTADLLRTFLKDNLELSGKIYRNFFAKLMLIGAEKCILYNIWPSYNSRWQQVIVEYRLQLLQDNFTVSSHLDQVIGKYAVLLFKDSDAFLNRTLNYEDDGCIVTMLKSDGLDYLTRNMDEVGKALHSGSIHAINPTQLLKNKYQQRFEENKDLEIIDIIPEETIVDVSTVQNEGISGGLIFDKLDEADIQQSYIAIYEKLTAIGIDIRKDLLTDINFMEGPAFYRIEIKPAPTTTIKKIKSAVEELNIALHLREEESVRVFSDLGKIWLEVPKRDEQKVMITTAQIWPYFNKTSDFNVPFGTDINGTIQSVNFSSSNSPHLLLAGTTGSGKSVVLDTLIRGAANFYSPQELQIFLIDPKGNELIDFEDLPHVPKANGTSSEEAINLLKEGVEEMDRRYQLFREIRKTTNRAAKDIREYNDMVVGSAEAAIPRWLIILDEYSDLLDESPANKGEIETLLKRLAQKARAAGIHVIVATQKPLVSIVSSAIKSNLPGVIALRVRTANDSRVILDDGGAETLAGKGDSLFKNGTGQMVRVQCAIHQV